MMRDCADGNLRDLLPAYVHETLPAAERARVAAHVGSCVDCAAEVELIRAALRAYPAPAVDIRRIVKSLPAAPRERRSGGRLAGREWLVAAAVGFVVIGAISIVSLRGAFSAKPIARAVPSAGSRAESATVAVAKAAPVPDTPAVVAPSGRAASPRTVAPSISFGGGLGDLTDEQLNMLLGEIDALDALPTVEPETHLTPIIVPDEGGHRAR
jgi:hypothetical protein